MMDQMRAIPPVSTGSPSMAGRAALALALMVGFYVLAIGISLALLLICFLMVANADRVPVKVLFFLVVTAGLILWSIIPRFDRFIAPGPRLMPDRHPKLFAELRAVAQATGQEMPAEVYLESDVNAWVAQRGGIMGLGSRRVMGLGLGLMRVLNLPEFRAVIAHEFGHYHGGDTKLGPWVYKTRSSIGRTIGNLGGSFMQKPFLWYGNMFLRVTHAVSRRQEFTADRLAATLIGREALASGLRKTHGAGMAFEPFWRSEMVPVLSAGYKTPIAEGFARFMRSSPVASALTEAVNTEMREAKTNPYDTHPPLPQRIAAVADLPAGAAARDNTTALQLLENLPELERALLASIAGPEAAGKLADARWEEVGRSVYVPLWRRMVEEQRAQLQGVTPETLPDSATARLPGLQTGEQLEQLAATVGAALTLAAVDAGASLGCDPGAPVTVTADGVTVEPFTVLEKLRKGELLPADWRVLCAALGIAGLDLSTVSEPGGAVMSAELLED